MECPVCNTTGLAESELRCPKCNSDLEALQMSGKIKKDSRNRLSFGIVMSILFLAVLAIWIFTGMKSSGSETASATVSQTNTEKVNTDLSDAKSQVDVLKRQNEKLRKQLAEVQNQKAERTKEYIVQNGESLYVIARKIYGNGFKYVDIAKANNISDPNRIKTGQKLIIYY